MIFLLQIALVFSSLLPPAPVQTGARGFKVREPNLYAPQLYADTLDFKATLVNLPGATNKAELLGTFLSALLRSRRQNTTKP